MAKEREFISASSTTYLLANADSKTRLYKEGCHITPEELANSEGIPVLYASIIFGLWIFLKFYKEKVSLLDLTDLGVMGLPAAQALGRLGNWVNGELYGRNGEPLFAYEGVLNLILFGILWKIGLKKKPGALTGAYLIGYGVIRMVLENLREEEVIWRLGNVPTAVIFSLVAIIIGAGLIWRKRS